MREALEEERVRSASLDESLSTITQELEGLRTQVDTLQRQLQEVEEQKDNLIDALSSELEELRSGIVSLRDQFREVEEQNTELRELESQELRNEIQLLKDQLQEAEQEKTELKDVLRDTSEQFDDYAGRLTSARKSHLAIELGSQQRLQLVKAMYDSLFSEYNRYLRENEALRSKVEKFEGVEQELERRKRSTTRWMEECFRLRSAAVVAGERQPPMLSSIDYTGVREALTRGVNEVRNAQRDRLRTSYPIASASSISWGNPRSSSSRHPTHLDFEHRESRLLR